MAEATAAANVRPEAMEIDGEGASFGSDDLYKQSVEVATGPGSDEIPADTRTSVLDCGGDRIRSRRLNQHSHHVLITPIAQLQSLIRTTNLPSQVPRCLNRSRRR